VLADRFKALDDVPIPDTWTRVQSKVLNDMSVHLTEGEATMIDLETPSQTDERRKGPRRVVVAVLLAAAAVAAITLVAIRNDDPVSPADQPRPTQPATTVSATAQALDVAEGFLTWRYADPDRAMSHLTDDLIVDASVRACSRPAGCRESFRLEGAMLVALGETKVNIRCQVQEQSPSGIVVGCNYDEHSFRSEEVGRAPFTGGFQTFTIRDGTIVSLGESRGAEGAGEYNDVMDDMFRRWLTTEYPDDAATLYDGEFPRRPFTEESIALFGQRTLEFAQSEVQANGQGDTSSND
jgi:hypothetical protein